MATKKCIKCAKKKPLDKFYRNKNAKDGHLGVCKICDNKRRLRRYRDNREQEIATIRQWQQRNPEKFLANQQRYYKTAKRDATQRRHTLGRRGLSLEQYDRLLASQGGVCAICGNEETQRRNGQSQQLSVDHNHDTGKIRGLLCFRCNFMLGNAADDPNILRAAANYIEAQSRAGKEIAIEQIGTPRRAERGSCPVPLPENPYGHRHQAVDVE